MPKGQSIPPARHTVLTPRSFLSFAATMFAIDLMNVCYGAVDLAFIAPFGVVMVSAVGLGDLVTLMYLAFFGGVIDVFAVRVAQAEGRSTTTLQLPQLFAEFLLVTILWLMVGIGASLATPALFGWIGSEGTVAAAASSYVTVRMVGLPFTLILGAISVTLRLLGRKRASICIIFLGLVLNAALNALFLHGPWSIGRTNPVAAIAAATLGAQVLAAVTGAVVLVIHLRGKPAPKKETAEQTDPLTRGMLRTSFGVGLRQMNNYAAAVIPFMLISRLDVSVIAAATVATKIWTLYCRVPQASLGTSSVFIAFARGRNQQEAHAVAVRSFRYTAIPSLFAAIIVAGSVPLLARLLGGGQIDLKLVWTLTAAYLVAIPFYLVENFAAEILTVEQQGAWLSVASSIVAYLVAIPVAAVAVLAWGSATIAVLSAGVSSLILAVIFGVRIRQLGYSLTRGRNHRVPQRKK